MTEIEADKAQTDFVRLLERVRKGGGFVITVQGKPVAQLLSVRSRDRDQIKRAIAEIREVRADLYRRGVRLSNLLEDKETLRELAHHRHSR